LVRVFLSLNIAPISSGHHVNIAFAHALAEKKSARPARFELQCAGTIFPALLQVICNWKEADEYVH